MRVAGYGPELETVFREQSWHGVAFVCVEGPLRAPVGRELRHRVAALLGHGQRSLVLDLTRVAELDAAGVGELVYVYTQPLAADAVLRLAHATERVRRLLDVAGLVEVLGVDSCCYERCS